MRRFVPSPIPFRRAHYLCHSLPRIGTLIFGTTLLYHDHLLARCRRGRDCPCTYHNLFLSVCSRFFRLYFHIFLFTTLHTTFHLRLLVRTGKALTQKMYLTELVGYTHHGCFAVRTLFTIGEFRSELLLIG